MRPPFYKRMLSHLMDIRLEQVRSDLHATLTVSLSRGRYQLSTPNAIYSYADLYDNFATVFTRFHWDALPGSEVLLLGMGLGSIPYMLERTFQKSFRYTAVELDEQVIRLLSKYVLDDLKSPVVTVHGDATEFVRMTEQHFDLICVDIFVDDVIPAEVRSRDFLADVHNRLSHNGIVLFNCLSRTEADIGNTRQFLEKVFLVEFPLGGIIDVGGNWILVNRLGVIG